MATPNFEQRFEEVAVIADVASAMLSPLGLDEVLQIAVERVSRALGAHFGSITRLSADGRTLEFAAVHGLSPDYGEKFRRRPLPADQSSPPGMAVATRQPYTVANVAEDPLCAPWRDIAEEEGFRSLITVPLFAGEQVIGTLNQYLSTPHQFTVREVRLLTVVAQQVSLALERGCLYEQVKEASARKSQFLATLSHEMRTPLTAIVGFAEILLRQTSGPLNDDQRRQLRLVAASAEHLTVLMSDALDLVRIESGTIECPLEPVDARAVIREVLALMEPLARAKRLQLAAGGDEEPLLVRANRQRVRQVLFNLVANAIKFTPRGSVEVRALQESGDATHARIVVCDTGMGIRPEDLPGIFEEYGRGGAGLGLAISRRLARLMRGDLEAQSTWGSGSTFTLTLEAA